MSPQCDNGAAAGAWDVRVLRASKGAVAGSGETDRQKALKREHANDDRGDRPGPQIPPTTLTFSAGERTQGRERVSRTRTRRDCGTGREPREEWPVAEICLREETENVY